MIPPLSHEPGTRAAPSGARIALRRRATLTVAILAAGGLAAGLSVAQDNAAHSAHSHARTAKSTSPHSGVTGTLKSQASYSLGVIMGTQLHQFGLDERAIDFHKVEQGLRDVVSGKAHPSTADQQNVENLIRQVRSAAAVKNEAAARKFLAANAKRPGVKTTPSGLEYKVLTPGHGDPPSPTDQVTVNYRGTLLDGTEFDSSYRRGQPATFPVNGVIKGWQEALVKMKPGAKWQLFIPPSLAYGDNSPPQSPIPPGSLLKFDVELLSVKPGGSAPGGAGPNVGDATGH